MLLSLQGAILTTIVARRFSANSGNQRNHITVKINTLNINLNTFLEQCLKVLVTESKSSVSELDIKLELVVLKHGRSSY